MVSAPKRIWKSFSRGQYWPHFLLPPSSSLRMGHGDRGATSSLPASRGALCPPRACSVPLQCSVPGQLRDTRYAGSRTPLALLCVAQRCFQGVPFLWDAKHRSPAVTAVDPIAKPLLLPPRALTESSSRSPGRSAPTPCARSHHRCSPGALQGQPAVTQWGWALQAVPGHPRTWEHVALTLCPDVRVPLLVAIHEAGVDVVSQLRTMTWHECTTGMTSA